MTFYHIQRMCVEISCLPVYTLVSCLSLQTDYKMVTGEVLVTVLHAQVE